jgi:HD-GYP domain-containing protein (c-di-GMP phosphodiesterase class II)
VTPLSVRVRLYAAVVRVVALALGWALFTGYHLQDPRRDLGTALVLGALFAIARSYPLSISPETLLYASTAAAFAGVLLLAAPLAAVVCGVGCLCSGLWLRSKIVTTSFNAAVVTLSVGLSGLSLHLLASFPLSSPPPLAPSTRGFVVMTLLAAISYYILQGGLVHGVIGLQLRQNPFSCWLATERRVLAQEVALLLIGVFAALAAREQFWSLLILTIPGYVVYRSLRDGIALRVQTKETIQNLADIVDMRDHYTFEHSRRVAELSAELARRLGLSNERVETIFLAARVHDVGKIGVSSQVLYKQGPLDEAEWKEMRGHSEAGAKLIDKFPDFKKTRELILHHHERYDGKGYPQGLAGEQIPFGARVIAVADTYDAMTTQRPYRAPLSRADVLEQLRQARGTQLDPRAVDAFLPIIEPRAAVESPATPPAPQGSSHRAETGERQPAAV